jgi:hypothetical protein
MRESMAPAPRKHQAEIVEYLRSGLILGVTMGAGLLDWFDRSKHAVAEIDGRIWGGVTEMSDGTWFWYAGLIYFVEKYNVKLPDEFIEHAARNGWRVDRDAIPPANYECDYFAPAGR